MGGAGEGPLICWLPHCSIMFPAQCSDRRGRMSGVPRAQCGARLRVCRAHLRVCRREDPGDCGTPPDNHPLLAPLMIDHACPISSPRSALISTGLVLSCFLACFSSAFRGVPRSSTCLKCLTQDTGLVRLLMIACDARPVLFAWCWSSLVREVDVFLPLRVWIKSESRRSIVLPRRTCCKASNLLLSCLTEQPVRAQGAAVSGSWTRQHIDSS
ncbi:hypothetical protein V8E36_005421 [Tilletia maclaganii]